MKIRRIYGLDFHIITYHWGLFKEAITKFKLSYYFDNFIYSKNSIFFDLSLYPTIYLDTIKMAYFFLNKIWFEESSFVQFVVIVW